MVWLAETFEDYRKLKQQKVGDEWVDARHPDLIEELATCMVPGWPASQNDFPGVDDDEFVAGKRRFAEARGLTLDIKWMKSTSLNLDWGTEILGEPTWSWIKEQIDEDEDIEISTPRHWVTLSGYMCEQFDDANDNGIWDPNEDFWDDNYLDLPLGTAGIYDCFLRINDPADGSDGWQVAETRDGKLYVGPLGYIETAVSESPIPEPCSVVVWSLFGVFGMALRWRQGKGKLAGGFPRHERV
ncbi:MAG: hypothetical protein A2V70_17270 [Planctomycetes bacterium RBG_13_63_9]|nr:MAG: hypothetical protein A2V70_17270 [Planctomycetes bacterium RBG_13_63_9]